MDVTSPLQVLPGSLPQALGVGAAPTFGGLTIGTLFITGGGNITVFNVTFAANGGLLVNAATVDIGAAGAGFRHLYLVTGAAGTVGTATLVGGTVTVATSQVNAASIILISRNVVGGTVGDLRLGAITAGTSFVINSASGTDTSTVNWAIIN